MATFWLFSIILSAILTIAVAGKFNLKRVPFMTFLNVICPFAGLAYALYVVHVIVPKVIKQNTGQDVESPLLPFIEKYKALAIQKWHEISNSDDDKRL